MLHRAAIAITVAIVIACPSPVLACDFSWSRRVRTQIKLAHPRLRYCYARAAQLDHALAGTVVLRFTIRRDGSTTQIALDGTLANAMVRTCIAGDVATWTFSPQDTPTRIHYPLTFRLVGRQ